MGAIGGKDLLKILLQVLKYEDKLILEAKSKGQKILKPSTLILWLFGFFYAASPLDLIPELIITPRAFGFIEDLIVLTAIIILTSSDLGGIINYASRKIPAIRIPEPKGKDGPTEVSVGLPRNEDVLTVLRQPTVSSSNSIDDKPFVGSSSVPNPVPSGDDTPVIEDAEFDDEDFFNDIKNILGPGTGGNSNSGNT